MLNYATLFRYVSIFMNFTRFFKSHIIIYVTEFPSNIMSNLNSIIITKRMQGLQSQMF